jgi:hypothetical protein
MNKATDMFTAISHTELRDLEGRIIIKLTKFGSKQ